MSSIIDADGDATGMAQHASSLSHPLLTMLQAIFLDRDGVINHERADYVKSWEEFQLLPNVLESLQRLATLHIPICVLTNQSALARGYLTAATLDDIHQRLARMVTAHGGQINAFFICPHHPDDACACRKPKPGLLHQAAQHFKLDLDRCLFIGDAYTDYLAANAAHCHAMLVQSGRQGQQLHTLLHEARDVPILPSLTEAVDEIFQHYANCN